MVVTTPEWRLLFYKAQVNQDMPSVPEDEKKGRMSGMMGGASKIQTASDQSDDY